MNSSDVPNVRSLFALEDEVAIVTGGGTGLGRAIALALASAGARVAVVGRRPEPLTEVEQLMPEQIRALQYDVREAAAAPELVARVTDLIGTPTVLVNNAGIHMKKPSETVTDDDFRAVMETHVFGAHALNNAVIPGMRSSGRGSIVFIASMAALFGLPLVTAYAAAKSAYLGMVRSLAVEYGPDNIRVNAVAPGWIDSVMMRRTMEGDPKRAERVISRTALRRFGEPADIGAAAVYLCSPAARFVTGTCLVVDGGASVGF